MRALFIITVLAMSLSAFAQEKLTASVDKNTVRVGESFTLTLTFEGAASGVSDPQLGQLENLQVAGGPFTSTSFSIVNGRSSSRASYSYVLRAKQPGKGVIGAATAKYRGKDLTSNPVTVTVLSASAPAPTRDSRGGGSDVFLRVSPDKTTALLGEQVTLTYKLYFAAQITSPEILQLPRATGFWVEEIALPQTLPLTDELVSGKPYKVAVIRKSALFATATGELEVEPMVIQTKVEKRTKRRSADPFDIFNDPFFQLGRQFEPLELTSPGVTLHIKPLPQSGVPSNFTGAVGSFRLRASLDREQCKTDEASTLTIEIDGTGNIKTLPEPSVAFPADLQRFDPEVTDDIRRNQTKISGRKVFKYVLIPRAPGMQVIPAITFSYYDPEKNRYTEISSTELRLQVEKGTGSGYVPSGISVASKQGVENVGTDIAFAKTNPGQFVNSFHAPHQSALFWFFSATPWIALAAFTVVNRQQARGGARLIRRRALQNAHRSIAQAVKLLKNGKSESILRKAADALAEIYTAALGKNATGMPQHELEAEWHALHLDPVLLDRLLHIQSECDRARFTSSKTSTDSMKAILQELGTASRQIERADSRVGGKK